MTNNVKHFPQTSLNQFRVEAKSADDFLTSLFDLSAPLMIDALQLQLQGKRKPQLTLSDLLAKGLIQLAK